jgi:hypothetical protein
MVVVAVIPVARAVALLVRVKAALVAAIAVAVLPMPVPANFVARPAKDLVTSVKAALMTALQVKAHRALTSRRAKISRHVPTLVPRVLTLRRGNQQQVLPNLATVAKCLCRVMRKSVRRAVRVKHPRGLASRVLVVAK